MKGVLCIIFLTIVSATMSFAMEIEYVRSHYEKAVEDRDLCRRLMDALAKQADEPLSLGYLGAFQTIWANHTSNPIAKLSTFRRGKKNIERAISLAPENVELRFIRLSVQVNCPAFLGYDEHIEGDRAFIRQHMKRLASPTLRQMCQKLI